MRLRRSLTALVLMSACLTLVHGALADSAADAKKQISALYVKADRALMKKDLKTIFGMMAPDYTAADQKGEMVNMAQIKAQMQQIVSAAKSITVKTTVTKFAMKGKEAVATTSSRGRFVLTNPQNGQTMTLAIEGIAEDTWAKGAKGWQQKFTKVISQKMTPISAPKAGGKKAN